MKPQIFVSSTFYDLKHIREMLSRFIESYRYEPVLFENGGVCYIPGQPLDYSCYDAIKKSDMVILIIGGRYGSPATGETKDDFEEYLSVTHKEFKAAREANVTIYVFVDADVMTEYYLYEKNMNKDFLSDMNFCSVDNINVFRFIKIIKMIPGIPIESFHKVEDITLKLSRQWAGLFAECLKFYKEKRVQENVNDINTIVKAIKQKTDSMNIILENLNSYFINSKDEEEYKRILYKQEIVDISNIISNSVKLIAPKLSMEDIEEFLIEFLRKLLIVLKEGTIIQFFSDELEELDKIYKFFDFKFIMLESIEEDIQYSLEKHMEIFSNTEMHKEIVQELMKIENLKQMKLI